MRHSIVLSLISSTALLFASACTQSEKTDDTVPSSAIAAFNVRAYQDGEAIDAHHRVWYSVRLANRPDEVKTDHDLTVDVYGPEGIAALRDEADGVPKLEGIQYIVDDNERLWMNCALGASASRDETWCLPSVHPLCLDYDCIYDFRVSHEPFNDGIPDGRGWADEPESWASGELRWEKEFVPAGQYDATYREALKTYDIGGVAVDLTINDEDVHARGWIRRLKEEQGITVELPTP